MLQYAVFTDFVTEPVYLLRLWEKKKLMEKIHDKDNHFAPG